VSTYNYRYGLGFLLYVSRNSRPAIGVRYDPYPVTVATVTVPRRTEPGTYDTYAGAVAAGTSHASVTSYAATAPPTAVAATADPYQLQPIAAAFPRVQPAGNTAADSFARELLELYSSNPAAFTTFAAARSPLMRQSATGLGSGAVPMAVGVTELPSSSYTLAPARTDYFEKRLGPGFVSRIDYRNIYVGFFVRLFIGQFFAVLSWFMTAQKPVKVPGGGWVSRV